MLGISSRPAVSSSSKGTPPRSAEQRRFTVSNAATGYHDPMVVHQGSFGSWANSVLESKAQARRPIGARVVALVRRRPYLAVVVAIALGLSVILVLRGASEAGRETRPHPVAAAAVDRSYAETASERESLFLRNMAARMNDLEERVHALETKSAALSYAGGHQLNDESSASRARMESTVVQSSASVEGKRGIEVVTHGPEVITHETGVISAVEHPSTVGADPVDQVHDQAPTSHSISSYTHTSSQSERHEERNDYEAVMHSHNVVTGGERGVGPESSDLSASEYEGRRSEGKTAIHRSSLDVTP